jgi:hypothetical protein
MLRVVLKEAGAGCMMGECCAASVPHMQYRVLQIQHRLLRIQHRLLSLTWQMRLVEYEKGTRMSNSCCALRASCHRRV